MPFLQAVIATTLLTLASTAGANEAQRMLSQLSSEKQDAALQRVVSSSGESCLNIKRKMFSGSDARGNAMWSVGCSNGKSFMVMLKNDRQGSTTVLDCPTLQKVSGQKCFTKL